MNLIADPLLKAPSPDRLHYATGELLGADDFRAEQTYHRRQLARALLLLHGRGTVAGLRVRVKRELDPKDKTKPRLDPKDPAQLAELHLEVQPGLAIDGAGRLIEVPRNACLRLRRWFNYFAGRSKDEGLSNVEELRLARRGDPALPGKLVADVFLTFHPCNRGYTPTFASGPFDSLDASQPSRVRDGYELSLVLRKAGDPLPEATNPWSNLGGGTPEERLESARAFSLGSWHKLVCPDENSPGDWQTTWRETWKEIPDGVDPTAVLLARLEIPVGTLPADTTKAPMPDWTPATWPDENTNLDNRVRHFLLSNAALARIAGLQP